MAIDIDESIIFYAFRYALGRRTAAVDKVVTCLYNNWSKLLPQTQQQIKDEIKVAIERGQAGGNCDVKSWEGDIEL